MPRLKTSILICAMDDGTNDLYVNGVQVLTGERPATTVVNGEVHPVRIESICNSSATTASVIEAFANVTATLTRVAQQKKEENGTTKQ